jgi:hypothetical protein
MHKSLPPKGQDEIPVVWVDEFKVGFGFPSFDFCGFSAGDAQFLSRRDGPADLAFSLLMLPADSERAALPPDAVTGTSFTVHNPSPTEGEGFRSRIKYAPDFNS